MPALQSFVDKVGPTVSASWLNIVDVLCTTVFNQAATAPAARTALYSDLPLEIINGGTAARTLAAARASLTSDAPWSISQGGTGQTAAGQALLVALGLTQAVIGNIFYPQTAAEIAAGVTPTNYTYRVPQPERYGAKGDGVTDDTTALQNCIAANNAIQLNIGATYLTTGLTFKTTGGSIFGTGGSESRSVILLANGAGNKALYFVSTSGNATHFNTGFIGRDFAIKCQAGAVKMTGIYCDNAELQCLDNVIVDLSANTYSGTSRGDGTIGLYGYFQQDGVFLKSTFTGGTGAYSDGVYLTGSIAANTTPNDNLFLGCRAQSCGGFGVRLVVGDGNKWIGGKIQGNTQGGWADDTDGLGGGPSNSMLLDTAFEANSGDDLYINISSGLRCLHTEFESTGVTNHIHAPNFCTLAMFEDCQDTSGKPVNFSGNTGTGNRWARSNRGFGTTTLVGFNDLDGGVNTLIYSTSISLDANSGRFFVINATDSGAFTINNPTNPQSGQIIAFDIKNFSGGIMGAVTWGTAFKLAGAFTNPVNNNHRTIMFMYDGAAWREVGRAGADELS